MTPDPSAMIQASNVSRSYAITEGAAVAALEGVDLTIGRDTFTAITGESGCGKSTLLHILGALDSPTSGEVRVDGIALHSASERDKTKYRRTKVGIVFQAFHLMPTLTVLENAALPLLLQGVPRPEAEDRASEKIALVKLGHRAGHLPHQLSGGERQRTAIARALAPGPSLLLADEPTGNLDQKNASHILELLQDIHAQRLATLVVVTHSDEVAEGAAQRVHMADGKVVEGVNIS